jgi:GNAT superfamily N-acetyltransferase
MTLQIIQQRKEHLEDCANLVSGRFKALREQIPILPPCYEGKRTILDLLSGLSGEPNGVIAIDGSEVVGFLTGFTLPEFLGKRTFYSPEWANGALIGGSRRIYDEMYARISARWVEEGCYNHAITLMANDPKGIEGWHWLGFGLVAVDGVRPLQPMEDEAPDFELRRASMEDAPAVKAFAHALEQHLLASPVFWMHQYKDIGSWLKETKNAVWLAYEGKKAVGCMTFVTGYQEGCRILQDDGTISIISAYTDKQARSRGIASALLNRGLAWAQDEGYTRCGVDFEPMNVPATRFWSKRFEPVCYSVMRTIDDRIGRSK